jgi:hypothetical protein
MKLIDSVQLSQVFESVTVDFFAPYHGKCVCDGWFALLSGLYEWHSMATENTSITTTEELINLFTSGLNEYNDNTVLRNSKKSSSGLYIYL